jgi:Zn-dependent metalloprotease
MLKKIVKNGKPEQKLAAMRTLEVTHKLKFQRRQLSSGPTVRSGRARVVSAINRVIQDAHGASQITGPVVRKEGDPLIADMIANVVFDSFGQTNGLYNHYGRNSYDNFGAMFRGIIHYGKQYNNAFWDGRQMVFGDGDGSLFTGFATTDIVGHEVSHGLVQYTANLIYENQPGALNEHFSDVFGSLVKQRSMMQGVYEADWLIGQVLGPTVRGEAIRSIKAPGTAYNDPVLGRDPQPSHMKDFWQTTQDEGGVHVNSGIPNYAFYLAAMEIGGYGWEKTGRIWYRTLRDKLTWNSQFIDAAHATTEMAASLFKRNSREHKAVRNAWEKVGLL